MPLFYRSGQISLGYSGEKKEIKKYSSYLLDQQYALGEAYVLAALPQICCFS